MTWFKVDDQLATHPKAVAAGNTAMGLWVRAGSWSAAQLTDGFIPADMIAVLGGKRSDARRLVEAGLWCEATVRDRSGYQFHQWNDEGRQPTRDQVEADRAAWRARQRKSRQSRKGGDGAHLNIVTQ